ncbi:hypothetical protein DMN91_005536 [Ooceraea biroi]|uniref:Protein vav n=1 Tax=Ooceraea biroi TaxID=2015173 RepID=A0A026W1X0_OOCBI|nr:protein vav [Ooceraea biroi]EZA50028.1 Protein vav [Ooceraea biroi]RLU21163.1 hypothetical protein DMN91_005536 [Ooceraea biroi]
MSRPGSADAGKDWYECINWLTRCGVLGADHKANGPDATAFDLAYVLQDGVLLCNLLNIMHPGSIDVKHVNQKPQLVQFLCLRNIKMFLTVCSNVFGLSESELFEPAMLFDLSNFHRVLCTLSALSNCSRFRRNSIYGFSIGHVKSQENINSSYEEIYQRIRLHDYDDADCRIKTCIFEEGEYSTFYSYPQSEKIYQNVCGLHLSPPPFIMQSDAGGKKRDYVIQELVDTERNYMEFLNSLLKHFARPLSSLLRPEDSARIFFGLKELSEIHAGFHSQLCKTRNSAVIAQIFLDWKKKFLIYGDYCANLTTAQNTLQETCARNEVINQEVIRCQIEANNNKFKLCDILPVPIQRLLKYQLLLDKLIKETPCEWVEDYQVLMKAQEAMIDIIQYTNEVKCDSDTLDIIKDIQASIMAWDAPEDMQLKNFGRLLRDGELKVKPQGDLRIKTRYVFVFEQMMLICKPGKADQYRYRETLWLNDYKLEYHTNKIIRHSLSKSSRRPYEWLLVHKQTCTMYTLYARTEEQKQIWIKTLQKAMDNINPEACRNTNHKFKFTTFDTPNSCLRCDKFLKGLILQGYKCEMCHLAVHKHCIADAGHCMPKPLSPTSSSPTLSSPTLSSPTLSSPILPSPTLPLPPRPNVARYSYLT